MREIHFEKRKTPSQFSRLVFWESSVRILRQSVKYTCSVYSFKEGTLAQKRGSFFLFQNVDKNSPMGNHMLSYVSTLKDSKCRPLEETQRCPVEPLVQFCWPAISISIILSTLQQTLFIAVDRVRAIKIA